MAHERGVILPAHFEPVETPVDRYGFVKVKSLEKIVSDSFSSTDKRYHASLNPNNHHLYWPAHAYEPIDTTRPSAVEETRRTFRNHTLNQLKIGTEAHRRLHEMTLPPDMPDDDVMFLRLKYMQFGRAAFIASSWIVRLDRQMRRIRGELPSQGEFGKVESRRKSLQNHLRRYDASIQEVAKVPAELHVVPIDPNRSLRAVATRLGLFFEGALVDERLSSPLGIYS